MDYKLKNTKKKTQNFFISVVRKHKNDEQQPTKKKLEICVINGIESF